jgi:hypothetical protein
VVNGASGDRTTLGDLEPRFPQRRFSLTLIAIGELTASYPGSTRYARVLIQGDRFEAEAGSGSELIRLDCLSRQEIHLDYLAECAHLTAGHTRPPTGGVSKHSSGVLQATVL